MNWKCPGWMKELFLLKENDENVLKNRIISKVSDINQSASKPYFSIVVPIYNEIDNILICLSSILNSNSDCRDSELIFVDNNSTDGSYELLVELGVDIYKESNQGIGWARQKGLEKAKGDIVITADADCIYSPDWISKMLKPFEDKNNVCVTTAYNFYTFKEQNRWKMQAYELLREIPMAVRNFKHPYLNAWGGAMAFRRKEALKCNYDTRGIRGEDGRLCFDLMTFGKIHRIYAVNSMVWTSERTNNPRSEESLGLYRKLNRELFRFVGYFIKPKPHDTKNSENFGD